MQHVALVKMQQVTRVETARGGRDVKPTLNNKQGLHQARQTTKNKFWQCKNITVFLISQHQSTYQKLCIHRHTIQSPSNQGRSKTQPTQSSNNQHNWVKVNLAQPKWHSKPHHPTTNSCKHITDSNTKAEKPCLSWTWFQEKDSTIASLYGILN